MSFWKLTLTIKLGLVCMCVHMWVGGQKLRERKRESRGGGRQAERDGEQRCRSRGITYLWFNLHLLIGIPNLSDYTAILRTPVKLNYYFKRPHSNIAVVEIMISTCESERGSHSIHSILDRSFMALMAYLLLKY